MQAQSLPLRKPLAVRQARLVLLITLGLGLLFGILQIFADYRDAKKEIDSTILQILHIIEKPATQAIYNVDQELAADVIKGLFRYRPVYRVTIIDEYGERMAYDERALSASEQRWLSEIFFKEHQPA
ncbi:MAG: hypothetical protein GY862_31265 [Gammaproteobacteria bacterium]|nr:hypothetical protein [Gammaproteobacteria bacterium]